MKNPALNNAILKILSRLDTGLREKTLQAETELAMDRPDLTTDEFLDSLGYLEGRGLVDTWTNLIGDKIWGITAAGRDALARLHAGLVSGDADLVTRELGRALLDTVSHYDLRDEGSCHMWLLSLLYGMDGYRFPRSNREVGRGRPDVVVEPEAAREGELPAVAVEVKFARGATPERLRAEASAALKGQAVPGRYAHGLAGCGAILWAVAFDNHKNVAAEALRVVS